jgi:two-component system chemotaxis sensor kinase CheA
VPGDETIRVPVAKLDDLMAEVGELLVHKISAEQRQSDFQQLQHLFQDWLNSWREVTTQAAQLNGGKGRPLNDALARHADQMQAFLQAFNRLSQSVNGDTVRLGMTTASLQDKVRQVRMIPFQTLALGLERAVRDAARTGNKQVVFQIEGGGIELDKKVLEILKDPLLHLLRNAVDHGIEDPETREEAGKTPSGQVSLVLQQRGSEVRMTVRDDGRGFDLDALARCAGDAWGEGSTADELINLAFQPGVTTAREVTALSGRGVGLDVVRKQLETIHGRISVNNTPGEGVSIELIVPTSMAITRG